MTIPRTISYGIEPEADSHFAFQVAKTGIMRRKKHFFEFTPRMIQDRPMQSEQNDPPRDAAPTVSATDSRPLWGRRLAIATATVFCTSAAFPLVAGLSKQTESFPQWWGPLDVGIAFLLGCMAFAVLMLGQDRVTRQADDASYRVYRVLIHGILAMCVAFIYLGDWIIWRNCMTGFAWRTWLMMYCLPAWFALSGTAGSQQ